MHDPETVAFKILRPWPVHSREPLLQGMPRFWPPVVTVWHVDPESDGSDDSCGWSRARIPPALRSVLDFEALQEARSPWLLAEARKTPLSAADAESLLRGAVLHVAHLCGLRYSYQRASSLAARLLHTPVNNLRSLIGFVPGWHSNSSEDREDDRRSHAATLLYAIARNLLTEARPWWRHPRWHFWHWRIEFHGLWAFDTPRSRGGESMIGWLRGLIDRWRNGPRIRGLQASLAAHEQYVRDAMREAREIHDDRVRLLAFVRGVRVPCHHCGQASKSWRAEQRCVNGTLCYVAKCTDCDRLALAAAVRKGEAIEASTEAG